MTITDIFDAQAYKKYSHISYVNNFQKFEYYKTIYYLNSDNTEFITGHTYNIFYKAIYYFFNSNSPKLILNNIPKEDTTSSFWKNNNSKHLSIVPIS